MISREQANAKMIEALVEAVTDMCAECRDLAYKTGWEAEAKEFMSISERLTEFEKKIKNQVFDSLI